MLSSLERNKLKEAAIGLRKKGESYPTIESKLGVKRSTLSGWLKNIDLPLFAQEIIQTRKQNHMVDARLLATKVNLATGEAKRKKVNENVMQDFSNFVLTSQTKEALLAMLYLGEGFKKKSVIGLGNSNPRILKMFVQLLTEIYSISVEQMTCYLYLRADQDSEVEKKYWSNVLGVPLNRFRKSQVDKRTSGKKTWKNYHGVCSVYCYNAELEKRLTAWQEILLDTFKGS